MISNEDISILFNDACEKAIEFFNSIYGVDYESKLYDVYIKLCEDKGITSFNVGSSKTSASLGTAFYQRVNHTLDQKGEFIENISIDYLDFIQEVFSNYTWPSTYEEVDGTERLGYGRNVVNKEHIQFQSIYSREFIDIADRDIWTILYAYFILNNGYDFDNLTDQDKRKVIEHLKKFNAYDLDQILSQYYDGQLRLSS